ncbi:CinA family protein, partial [Microbacterium sp. UBA7513]
LGVDTDLLERYGPVYPEVARQMAAGVRGAVAVDGLPADVGVSTTGIAGPESPDGQPVGTVHIGVITPTVSRTRPFHFEGDREAVRAQTVAAVLDVLAAALRE